MMHQRYVCVLNLIASLGRESQKGIDTSQMESQSFLSESNKMLVDDLLTGRLLRQRPEIPEAGFESDFNVVAGICFVGILMILMVICKRLNTTFRSFWVSMRRENTMYGQSDLTKAFRSSSNNEASSPFTPINHHKTGMPPNARSISLQDSRDDDLSEFLEEQADTDGMSKSNESYED
jgi:hypothetical protein